MIDTVEVVPGLTIEADVTRDVLLTDFERSLREAMAKDLATRLLEEQAREDVRRIERGR